jgi:hypothetical protein
MLQQTRVPVAVDGTDQYTNYWLGWSLVGSPLVITGSTFVNVKSFVLESSVVNKDSFMRELSVQLWSVNQWTAGAEEVANS